MTTAIKNTQEATKLILDTAKEGCLKTVRDARAIKGKTWAVRQGDLYVVRVGDYAAPKASSKKWDGSQHDKLQLVKDSTQGSKHCVAAIPGQKLDVTILDTTEANNYPCDLIADSRIDGPVVLSKGEWALVHPEHAHFHFPQGAYRIMHQLDASTMQAVRD
jgi:hypothetical protein